MRAATTLLIAVLVPLAPGPPEASATPVADGRSGGHADHVAEYAGGTAALVRDAHGSSVPGDLFLLMATAGSTANARSYEQTPFIHDRAASTDTVESNHLATEIASAITGMSIEPIEFSSAPGGGASAGLIYLIAHLNLISDGAFTGDLRVAATGELDGEGYITPVTAVAEKLAAAHLADVDVVFVPFAPTRDAVTEHAERSVGYGARSRLDPEPLRVERQLGEFEQLGATAPDGVDLVVVGHIADVAAYLCGAGSDDACAIADQLGEQITSDPAITSFDRARAALDRPRNEPPQQQSGTGTLR